MKKLILIICAILTIHAVHAQNEAKISGRLLNYTYPTITFWISTDDLKNKSIKKRIPLYQRVSRTVMVGKDGSFSLIVKNISEPFQISFYVPKIGYPVLFFANGYDLHITADASNMVSFRRTLAISGKGSGVNSFWLKLNDYRFKQGDTLISYKTQEGKIWRLGNKNTVDFGNEEAYLKHFTDSIKAVSALIASIGETDNDSHKEFFKESLLNDQKFRSALSLYDYSFSNQYTYDQTQNLLKKAGFPDARNYIRQFQFEKFPIPLWGHISRFEEMASLGPDRRSGPLQKDKYYQSHPDHPIIRARVEKVRYHQLIVEREGKRILGDAYAGFPFMQYPGGQNLSSYIIDGENYVELAGDGISEKNAADYRYRVIQNGIQVTGWTRPSQFRTTTDGRVRYTYFGKFVYKEGQMITLEVENIKDPSISDILLIDWRGVKKPVIGFDINYTTTSGEKLGPKALISRSLQGPMTAMTPGVSRQESFTPPFIVATAPDIRFRLADSLQSLSFTLKDSRGTYGYDITLKQKTSKATTITSVGSTQARFVLDKFYWDQPGEYEVKFMTRMWGTSGAVKDFKAQAETIRFTVMPALEPISFSLRSVLLILTAFVLCSLIIFYLYRGRQQKLVIHEQQQKELATLQLRSVRSQLNPHFMFNALAGIQNLMNRNDPDAANLYLSKFARLTRSVLDDNEKDLVTISSEIDLLKDYLEMEKMRFGFTYTFEIGPGIDKENTEIPSMLLQPFVENAVKHGVAGLGKDGHIIVRFRKRNKDLILQVQDNGSGTRIDANKGKGITLSENRINLYNRLYKETAITMRINQDKDGTGVTLELKDWI